jgi:dTDP-4-amino-4,6-dideoxygalactose transaminase
MQAKPPLAPKLPLFGPQTYAGAQGAGLPCLLDDPRAQFTTSGRAAILLAVEALGLGSTDRVLVPSYHCPTMVSPVLALGVQVGFYPIDDQGLPQLDWLRDHAPADTRLVCVTHLFGLPRDFRAVKAWCDERRCLLLEDCAHALFGRSAAGPVGSLGHAAIASLPKFLPTPDGGLLLHPQPLKLSPAGLKAELKTRLDLIETADQFDRLQAWPLARGLLRIKQQLRRRPAPVAEPPLEAAQFDPQSDYSRVDIALARRQATSACITVARRAARERIVRLRREHYQAMVARFQGKTGLRPVQPVLPDGAAPYVFPLWVEHPDPAYRQLRAAGVPISRWDWRWPDIPPLGDDHGPAWSHHVLQLACHQDLSVADRDAIITAILAHYATAS